MEKSTRKRGTFFKKSDKCQRIWTFDRDIEGKA
jgi:hypothetical protein